MSLQILKKEKIFEGKFIKLWGTKFLDKSGKEQLWEWISKKDVVAVLPFTKEGELILIKSFRVPIEQYCIETPSGLLDKPDEDKEDAEMKEEVDESQLSGSSRLVEIVFDNIVELFGDKLWLLKKCHKIAKESELLDQPVKEKISAVYEEKKNSEQGRIQYT